MTLVAKWTKNATQSNGSADAGNAGDGNASNANASNAGGKVLPQTGDTNNVTTMVVVAVARDGVGYSAHARVQCAWKIAGCGTPVGRMKAHAK